MAREMAKPAVDLDVVLVLGIGKGGTAWEPCVLLCGVPFTRLSAFMDYLFKKRIVRTGRHSATGGGNMGSPERDESVPVPCSSSVMPEVS